MTGEASVVHRTLPTTDVSDVSSPDTPGVAVLERPSKGRLAYTAPSRIVAAAPRDDAATFADGKLAPVDPSQAPVRSDPHAKPMTPVKEPSLEQLAGVDPGRRLREAVVSASNQAVIRRTATGEIDVPELGRVAVRAVSSAGGTVDVDVKAVRPETRAALHAAAGPMAADLRRADVPLGQLRFERVDGHSTPSDTSGRHGTSSHDTTRDHSEPQERDEEERPVVTDSPHRVRIVL
jgi:hypothetical protein